MYDVMERHNHIYLSVNGGLHYFQYYLSQMYPQGIRNSFGEKD